LELDAQSILEAATTAQRVSAKVVVAAMKSRTSSIIVSGDHTKVQEY
jgi:hypothetical protein